MTLTPHGHHIHGTTTADEDPNPKRMRCGGPGVCQLCSVFAAGVMISLAAAEDAEKIESEKAKNEGPCGPTYLYN